MAVSEILEGASIFRLRGGRITTTVERAGVLTGTVFDVYSEEGKAFWVATSKASRATHSFWWRQPAGMMEFDLRFVSIAEIARGGYG